MNLPFTNLFKTCAGLLSFLLLVSCSSQQPILETNGAQADFTQYVNPFIGTAGRGHTFPGATTPHGFTQLSPRTGNNAWDYVAGYQYRDSVLMGFSHNMLSGGGTPALGDVLILPYAKGKELQNGGVLFSKQEEKASPGYYATRLLEDDIAVELTATERTGVQKYAFNKGGDYELSVDIDAIIIRVRPGQVLKKWEAALEVEDNQTLTGFIESSVKAYRKSFFAVQFSKPFRSSAYAEGSDNRKLLLDYGMEAGENLEIRASISSVSVESAKKNLQAESRGKSFAEIKDAAKAKWNRYLSRVEITGTPEQKEIFYTAMYHLLLHPNNMADAEGQYRAPDQSLHTSPTNTMYSTFAFWDTYRGFHPLYTILFPEKAGEFVASAVRTAEHIGHLPVWGFWGGDAYVMIGNHGVPVVADAVLKGLPGIDPERAYAAVKATLTREHWGSKAGPRWEQVVWANFDKYGYHPADIVQKESISRTLEDAFDAWAAAQMAKKLGKTEDYELFSRRAGFYKNVFDPSTFFMRGRNSDGSWVEPFDPFLISHAGTSGGVYTEGNAWQYLWSVQHDPEGLIQLLGGKDRFIQKLDSLFLLPPVIQGTGSTHDVSGLIGQYAHGNEPSQHVLYLYNYAGQPHKTQALIRQVMAEQYGNEPDGLSGNDDFGQMSAWFVLNTLGFYPVNPASGVFDIGIPAVEEATVQVNDRKLRIKAKNFKPENKYIAAISFNGRPITNYQIDYADIMAGGELVFEMSDRPLVNLP